jgi:tetratricopeptide (TPR) repeat protein
LVSEGLIKKLVIQPKDRVKSFEKWENNLMKEFRYSTFSDPRIFGINISYGFIKRYRSSFNELARIYHYRADKKKVKEILMFKETVIPKDNIPIPWDDLKELYEDGELKILYDFAGLNFKEIDELDEMLKDVIETSWEPAALDTPYYYYRIGEFYLDKKEFSTSRQYIEEYLKYEPKEKRAVASLMYIEFEKNNYSKALELANELLEDDPENVILNYHLGQHYTSQKDYAKASNFFDKVLYVNDHDYDTYNSYGLLHLYQNHYQQALTNFEKVLEYSPSYSMNRKYAIENIAETYKAMGDNEKSIQVYYELIETDPTMCLAYSKLSILYNMQNQVSLSDNLLQIAKDNMWEDSYGQIGLACYYSHIGDTKTAIDYLKTAIEMGYSDYSWLEFDPDLENVRNTDEFWEIINE